MSKKNEIIENTYELFSRLGDTISLSVIAEASSIKKSSLYAHFDNKNHLLFHVITLEMQKFDEATFAVLEASADKDLEEIVKNFYFFNLDYFNDPTRLSFWKRCMLLSEGPLKQKVEKTHMKIHKRNVDYLTNLYTNHARHNDLDENHVHAFHNSFMVLILGTLYSLFVFENRVESYEHSFHIFWKGVQQHLSEST